MFHLTWELFGGLFPEYRSFYLKFVLDGRLAVCVFFVLSGDALSSGYLRTRSDRSLVRMMLKRYFRLMGPILFSCALIYVLLKLNLTSHVAAGRVVANEGWLGAFLPFDASFVRMLRYALLQVFTDHRVDNSYNPFLWPMSIELYGSFFIFAMLVSLRLIGRPLTLVWCVAGYLFLLGSFFSLFFIGLAYSLMRERGHFERIRSHSTSNLAFVAIIGIAVLDAALAKAGFKPLMLEIVMAALLVYSIYSNQRLVNFFSGTVSRYLGRISFPLYVSHLAVIVTIASWQIVYFNERGMLDLRRSGLIVGSSVLCAFLLAEIFTRLERIYLRRLDAAVDTVLVGGDKVNSASAVAKPAPMQMG